MKYTFFGPNEPGISIPELIEALKPHIANLSSTNSSEIHIIINMQPFVFNIQRLSGGMTNGTYKIETNKGKWVLRLAGEGTDQYINRKQELQNALIAWNMGLNAPIVWAQKGNLLTRFLESCYPLDVNKLSKTKYVTLAAQLFQRLHSGADFSHEALFFEKNAAMLKIIQEHGPQYLENEDLKIIVEKMNNLEILLKGFSIPNVPCHNDPIPANFLIAVYKQGDEKKKELKLLDWEYSSNNDPLWDLVYFIDASCLTRDSEEMFLKAYFGMLTEDIQAWVDIYKVLVSWCYTLWSWVQLVNQSTSCPQDEYIKLAENSLQKTKNLLNSEQFHRSFTFLSDKACCPNQEEQLPPQLIPRGF